MNKICLGCGSKLQHTNSKRQGFAVKEDATYCERCFRLLHYHELKMDQLIVSNEELFDEAMQLKKPIYFFLDLFQVSEETLSWFSKIPNEKVLVLTKIDLIPRSISVSRLIAQIKKTYNIQEQIFPFTKKSKKMLSTILNHMKGHSSLFLGMTNAGKSTFLKEASEFLQKSCPVLISEMPNTTLSFFYWNAGDFEFIDAPGFSYEKSWKSETMLKTIPEKYLKPITMQMKKETVLVLENQVFLKQSLEKNSFTFYGSNNLLLEKKYQVPENLLQKKVIKMPAKSDLVFPGVGFFAVTKECELMIYSKENLIYEIRPSLFGGIYYDAD